MRTLNLGIVAHVDAGKTSLTERILYEAGVLDAPGSVDAGDTRTDSMALERRRGITIRSAVVSFEHRGSTVNLIDTPGHSDFVAEVERALAVLDGAVLVVSAVEGVQAQTLVLMRALQRLGVPTLFFVNKVDRAGADPERVLGEIGSRLSPGALALGTATDAGTRRAAYLPFELTAAERVSLRRDLQSGDAQPVVFGSAITGAGVKALMDTVTDLVPAPECNPEGPARGVVFKVEHEPDSERSVLVRMRSGTLRPRTFLAIGGRAEERVTGLRVFERGSLVTTGSVSGGQIAEVRGLASARIGDSVGEAVDRGDGGAPGRAIGAEFTRPSLETVVEPVRPEDRHRLHAALTELADLDPLINLRQDVRNELSVSLYGEVQKEVIAAVLADGYGIKAAFRPTTTICIERVVSTGSDAQLIGVAPNPFLATVGLRVEPAAIASGVVFGLEVELGSMPAAFFTAVEEGVRATLDEGVHGWAIPDVKVVLTHSGYWPRQSAMHAKFDKAMSSTAADFRSLTRLVLAAALTRAGTQVCAPVHRFDLEVPEDLLGAALAELPRHRAVPHCTEVRAGSAVLAGDIPADTVHGLAQQIPHLTRGEGVLTTTLDHFAPVTGAPPERKRTQPDPFAQIGDLSRVSRTWPA